MVPTACSTNWVTRFFISYSLFGVWWGLFTPYRCLVVRYILCKWNVVQIPVPESMPAFFDTNTRAFWQFTAVGVHPSLILPAFRWWQERGSCSTTVDSGILHFSCGIDMHQCPTCSTLTKEVCCISMFHWWPCFILPFNITSSCVCPFGYFVKVVLFPCCSYGDIVSSRYIISLLRVDAGVLFCVLFPSTIFESNVSLKTRHQKLPAHKHTYGKTPVLRYG